MEKEDKRGIFFGVIGVLTLIVAIIGASLAYFSINAKSDPDALTVQAAQVKIVYNDGDQLSLNEIIPSSKSVAIQSFTRANPETDNAEGTYTACKDKRGYTVCGYYDFTLTNSADQKVTITAKVKPSALNAEVKEGGVVTTPADIPFTNLKFILFNRTSATGDFDNGTDIYEGTVPYNSGSNKYDDFSLLGATGSETLEINGNSTVKLRLFVWLNEAGTDNDAEQGATFKGTVNIDVVGSENGQLTGEL